MKMLGIFAESMRYVRDRKADWCLVRSHGKHLRLFAGRLIVLTLEADEVWIATDPDAQSDDWSRLRAWRWDERSYPRYKRVPSRNGYYAPKKDELGEWEEIRPAHHAYLDHVLRRGPAPDHRSVARHEPAFVEHIEATVANAVQTARDEDEDTSRLFSSDPALIADARERALQLVVQRRGQAEFRNALLNAYSSTCCFSGCMVEDALQAAHIIRYKGRETDHVKNGLLLRADLHTLFDLGLLTVDTKTMTIVAAPGLTDSIYADLHGKPIRVPRNLRDRPSHRLLDYHRRLAQRTAEPSR